MDHDCAALFRSEQTDFRAERAPHAILQLPTVGADPMDSVRFLDGLLTVQQPPDQFFRLPHTQTVLDDLAEQALLHERIIDR